MVGATRVGVVIYEQKPGEIKDTWNDQEVMASSLTTSKPMREIKE